MQKPYLLAFELDFLRTASVKTVYKVIYNQATWAKVMNNCDTKWTNILLGDRKM